ncbi:MAG: SDR family oxidoreductase [Sandaracinaceae bacterium]|jgi:UDP-glucose 4-epimerase|nr:SDR family oxidoreductase [Sandaracinaceae bacterium]MBP7681988.1 SDR family oxidoreductase [Deltaproteobacteria bacterium]MBK6813479.1 SDR family oxidoreductase [Sandaracinaceae bacterium]MBK7152947.1 SDR family oxidoreductase [Sandaracinaceae bacterium]MBK7773610.1 SDR family oxidoreductase [Sandaracinaceae bacterium]
MKVLITGISGKLGRLVGKRLDGLGHTVLGVDRRPWAGAPERVQMFQVDIRKRPAEDVFRTERPDAVIHMATVTHLTHKSPDRYRINLQGTRAIVENCHRYEVKQMLFVGRHTYYGAAADSPLYHTEDEPPMALNSFPELADLVAADLYAGSALWRYPEVNTCVLRLCYTLGGSKHGTLANFIRGPRVPTVLGFDPLFHFMHENDAADAIVAALDKNLRGVFNVSGPPPMLLSDVIRDAGRQNVPVPEVLMNLTLGRFGLPRLPTGAVDHLKFPIVIDSAAFKKATGFQHAYEESEALTAYRKSD